MRESYIEKKVSDYAKQLGWLGRKFGGPNAKGDPDHIYLRNGRTFFIEFKAPNKKATKLQLKRIGDLEALGFDCFVVDDIEKGKAIVDAQSIA